MHPGRKFIISLNLFKGHSLSGMRSVNFESVSPFLVATTNTFSELILPLLKCRTMFWNNSCTFYISSEELGSFDFLPLRGAGTGFVGVLPLPLIFYPALYILHLPIYTIVQGEEKLKIALAYQTLVIHRWTFDIQLLCYPVLKTQPTAANTRRSKI